MKNFYSRFGLDEERTRYENLKDFCEKILENTELADYSHIEPEYRNMTAAIFAIEQLIADCYHLGLGIMAPDKWVIIYNGQWYQLSPSEANKFLTEYMVQSGVPNLDKKSLSKAVDYLHNISQGLSHSIDMFRAKVAKRAMIGRGTWKTEYDITS